MATLDFTKALQSIIDDKSSDSKTNRRMVKTVYGPEVMELHKSSVQDYEDAILRTEKSVAEGKMTPEQALKIVGNYEMAMNNTQDFRKEFFKE